MATMFNGVLVRLGEYMVRRTCARRQMVSRLIESIRRMLRRRGFEASIECIDERIVVRGIGDPVYVAKLLSRVPGVSSTSPAYIVEDGIDRVEDVVLEFLHGRLVARETFMVRVHNAPYPLSNRGLEKYLGWAIQNRFGSIVNLSNPDRIVYVEFRGDYIIVTDTVYNGFGGLPYGVEGCLVSLLSGGVDSAVATLYALKRGVSVVPIYIDMTPYWSMEATRRARESIDMLWEWIPWDSMRAYIVHGVSELVARQEIPSRLRCLLCKAVMYNIASIIADREGCMGILTGEAVGQVASQTLKNLSVLTKLSPKPVYRPVAFHDKIEIVKEAHRLGLGKLDRDVGTCKLKPEHPATEISEKEYMILKEKIRSLTNDLLEIINEKTIVKEYR